MRFAATLWRFARVVRRQIGHSAFRAIPSACSFRESKMPQPTDSSAGAGTTLRIRRASPRDAESLAQLRYAFRTERRPATESRDAFTTRCADWMRPRLATDSRWNAWLAERGERIVGQVWVQIVEKIPNPGPEAECHAYLSNFFVNGEARNAGAGTELLRTAIEHCRALGADTVFLWATQRSMPLYERLGFTRPHDVLVLDLKTSKPR
jgi:GNAT superfamily N-acetyltransferase